jgi:GTP cyclohydrolase I
MSFNKVKTDPDLGLQIHQHLLQVGVETPTIESTLSVSPRDKIDTIVPLFMKIWETLGMDMSDDSLAETPKRMAKMWVNETMWGLEPENFPKCTAVNNKMRYDEMVIEKDITVMSQCEHHGVVIDGVAHIAYIPNQKVLGLSKLNRVTEYFSKRPQIQERLTVQIAEALKFILETDDVAVIIDAKHYCVKSRGVEDMLSSTTTSHMAGSFREFSAPRSEFLQLINSNRV